MLSIVSALNLVQHYKIIELGSEWPSQQGSCKLYMRGWHSEHHTPRLDLVPYKAPALQESTCRERGFTNIQMKPEIPLNHVGAIEFSSQMKNPISRLLLWNECFIYVFLCPKVTLILQIYSKRIHHVLFSAISFPPLSSSCLINQARMPCHSVICQSRSAFTHMKHVRFQWKPLHKPKSVFVCRWGIGADRGEVMADTQAECSGQWPITHGCSDMITEINTGQIWDVS